MWMALHRLELLSCLKESGVSSGVRRVEAICGKSALEYINRVRGELDEVKSSLKRGTNICYR